MALSLSPHQLNPALHTPLLVPSKPLQSYSTPRHFKTAVNDKPEHEVLSISSTESASKPSSSSQVLLDLPSWTPLKTLGEDDSEPEAQPKLRATNSAMKVFRELSTKPRATVENTATAAQPTSKPTSSGPKPFKRARFDGVLIPAKPPSRKKHGSRSKYPSLPRDSTSLVDALARTFYANRHPEDLSPRPSRTGPYQHDNGSAYAEVETSDPEELQLNSRLAHRPSKRQLSRISHAAASETNSEDVTPFRQDIPPPDRPIKRLKAIPYEPNAAAIDAALGTEEAPISWDGELDFITREDDYAMPMQLMADNRVGDAAGTGKVAVPLRNEWEIPKGGEPPQVVFTPYVSRGAKFRQRLVSMFGEDATVRTDRSARPRRVEFDYFAFDEPERESSPVPSESTVSASPRSVGEEDPGVVPSTHVMHDSLPDIPSAGNTSVDQLPGNELDEVPVARATFVVGAEQMGVWASALQRLVKGKVRIGERDLETLSIILAEIESLKDNPGNVALTSELRASIKQLSELREIPFGDRNMLRQRAENISQV